MVPALIKMFKTVAVASGTSLLDAEEVNKYAMACGYIVHPDACTPDAVAFLKSEKANFNTTFYKSWTDVERLSEFQMWINQMLHYMSTYGTDFQGEAWTMNDCPAELSPSRFTLLLPCTDEDLFARIAGFLASGIAVSDDTLALLLAQLREYYDKYHWTIDLDEVGNCEAQVRLSELYGTLPSKPVQLLRYILYVACGETLLIKNIATFNRLANGCDTKALDIIAGLDPARAAALSSIFYRYKPIFLALRRNAVGTEHRGAVKRINELRRLARKNHRPFTPGVLESILSPDHSVEEVADAIASVTNTFRLIKLLNYLRSKANPAPLSLYMVRNGKIFVTKNDEAVPSPRAAELIPLVEQRLIKLLSAKAVKDDGSPVTVLFPKHYTLAAPVSERQMVGSLPYGSFYPLVRNNYIGIYWRNEWGTHDFDLWMLDTEGGRIGWADQHKSDAIWFSGDMTDANPEATEIFYGRGDWPDSSIRVVRYNGEPDSKFRLFFGSDDIRELPENYMVNPDSIHFTEDLRSTSREMGVAVVTGGKMYLSGVIMGDRQLPNDSEDFSFEKAMAARFSSYATVKELLLKAGFEEFHPAGDGATPDIDLTNPDKDTLITLFTVNNA